MTIALYTSSRGNYFFNEIRDLLAAGLRQLGLQVSVHDEDDGFLGSDAWHIVVAPHEFFYLGAGVDLASEGSPGRLILINTEQPTTPWFQLAERLFSRAAFIWDIDFSSAQRLFYQGWPCRYLPLGFVPDLQAFQGTTDLPLHYGTCFLEPHVRHRPAVVQPLADRPIDVAFFGNPTLRRQIFFARSAARLAKYECYFHFSDVSKPLVEGKTTYMNSPTVRGLVQRSKILLNLHRDRDSYFEWHRIVMLGIWHQTLVMSEPCTSAPPFRPGFDFVEAAYDDLADRLEYYLADPRGCQEAQAIADEGFRTLSLGCRLADVLPPLIKALDYAAAENRTAAANAIPDRRAA